MTTRTLRAVALVAFAGCATRGDLVRQDRQLRNMLQEQRRQLQVVQKEVERLRADLEEGRGGRAARSDDAERVVELERRMAEMQEQDAAKASPPEGTAPATATPPKPAPAAPPAAPAAPAEDDPWRRDVAREQAAAGAVNVPERADYLALLDGVGRGDCAKQIPLLNSFAAAHKDSPLADNALYWAGRCYEQRGKQEDALNKFHEVVTRYPKGDKAAAALWAEGSLFVSMGNSPDARIVFSKLTREYPASEEAARARQKLTELPN